MASDERNWLLITKAVSGDISIEETEELEDIFVTRPNLRSDFENLKRLRLNTPGVLSNEERRAMERGIEKFSNSVYRDREFLGTTLFNNSELSPMGRKPLKKWMMAASVLIPLIAGAYLLFHFKTLQQPQQQKQTELITHNGKRTHTILPDGSTVWLNSGSVIRYTENLQPQGKREATLNGEAFFDVKHDAKHPFIVHAGKLDIVVLGTAFNVKAYSKDAFMETTLIRGKVEILNDAKPGAGIVLYPDEKVKINTGKDAVEKTRVLTGKPAADSLDTRSSLAAMQLPDEAIEETAWLSNKLSFKKENFANLATQLERWYNVKITFDNDTWLSRQFTGTFKDQDINEVMRALQLTQPFHYTITNDQIHIW